MIADHIAAELARPRVLVVDDSISMREGIASILRHIGCEVDTAENGQRGLEQARRISPDLILSDLEMPVATGFDLLSGIRSDSELAMLPFIMITGVSDRASTRRAMELGADDYLTKPFTPDEVIATVRGRLDKQRNWRQATQALAANYSQGMMNVLPHEFRTPLNSILGFAELMSMIADGGLTPTQTREFAETIQRAGRKLLSHTTRFLTLMEYQGQPTPAHAPAPYRITTPWAEAQIETALAEQLPNANIVAHIEIAEAEVHTREDLLATMLRELASNALKFADPGSAITVKGQRQPEGYVIEIHNSGHPFPVEKMRQIGAFVQFDRKTQEQQGLGIGLAMSCHAARLSCARLNLRNQPPRAVIASILLQAA